MDMSEGTPTDDLWTPFKELLSVVEGYLTREGSGAPYAVHTFESVLRRNKQAFLSLLKNPPKNPASREEIKRGITEGVTLPSIGKTLLAKELVEEACILSDMYCVNEYLALELLHCAARQSPRHPGLPRGLLAVLLYYDGRRALARALKELVMARDGVSWSVSAREEILKYVSRYVDQLISDGLLASTLDSVRRLSLAAELELLQNNRALPPRNHHQRLVDTIEGTRTVMAGVIFSASAQRGLPRDMLLRLIADQSNSPSQGPTGALDEVSLALHMALLYGLDLSVLHRREDGEELARRLPLIQDPELISVMLDELSPPTNPNQSAQEAQDKTSGVKALCQLSLGLALAALKRAPQSLLRVAGQETRAELLDQDEALVDAAIDGKVFEYLDEAILSSELVVKEEYYQRRLHALLTDFVALMHAKLMEMRARADEAARAVQMYVSEGVAPPAAAAAARSRLHALLRCVERLYAADPRRLRDDYWLACETNHSHTYRSGGRAATLYKFVRGWGALPSPSLGAWLRALAALAVPRHTWALLAARDPPAAAHLLQALHRYRQSLRADPSPFSDQLQASSLGASAVVTPAARPGRMLMRQEEVEAMIAALKLIAAVARVDSAACIAICENLQWDAINVMFGLVCCHVPLLLKAELLLTLAALGSCGAVAGRVWASLEAAQLVHSLHTELQEVECRVEEYPLSRAFVSLLTSLCAAAPLPLTLGAGAREPGLEPYVEHVLAKLALPAPHRRYAKPQERWQLLSLCLGLLSRWLDAYEPAAAELPPHAAPPPGARVALRLHAGDELLRLLLNTVREAVDMMPIRVPYQEHVTSCLEHSLRLLERALELERPLMQAAAEAGRSLIVVGLSKLILAPDPGDDNFHLVTVCRVLQHVQCYPGAAACALALLRRALRSGTGARRLLAAVTHHHHTADEIRHGFVECMEAPCPEQSDGADTALSCAALLHQLLPSSAPDLALWLLGLQPAINRTSLNEPGVGGAPRTCLHSLLDILERHIAGPDNTDRECTALTESCYHLLYVLCARDNTSTPLLRFLRTRDYALERHLKATINLERASPTSLSARSWVLRACAVEAGAAARNRSAATALLRALQPQEWEWCLLRRTLASLPVQVAAAEEPRWELLHPTQLRHALDECDLPTGLGGKRISVSRVHALLAREMLALNATTQQRNMLALEIQKVLDYVTEVNRRRNLAATISHYYDSWRQLTEILFCIAPPDLLSVEAKKTLILNILQDLLSKIPPADVLPQLGYLASGTVLLLLVNLRHCYILQKRESDLKSKEFENSFFGPSSQMESKSLTLKFVLHKILSWLLVSGGSTQKMRVNLYGALLNYLNIVNLKVSPAENEEDVNCTYVSRLDNSKGLPGREESALKSMVIDVISGFGDNLCSIVCSDCIGAGHDVCRMVALSCLDTLVEIHPGTDWMSTLTDQGYLRSLIDSLLQDDDDLQHALEPQPKSLRAIYVYESKMALLIKIAATRVGAATVLSLGALSCLANMRVLSLHPDVHTDTNTDLLPSVANRFRQILTPALALCSALLTSLGSENHSCVLSVTHLLHAHAQCADLVLRAAHPSSPRGLLVEAEALSGVLARAPAPPPAGRLHMAAAAALLRFSRDPPAGADEEDLLLHYKIVCNLLTCSRLAPPGSYGGSELEAAALLQLVSAAARGCDEHEKLLNTAHTQISATPNMTLADMKKLLPASPATEALPPAAARAALLQQLRRRARLRTALLQHARYTLQHALFLAWAQLHVSLRGGAGAGAGLRGKEGETKDPALEAATAARLRGALSTLLHDRFTEQLLDTAKNQSSSERSFLEVLLKDIKSMIQFSSIN